MITKSQHDAMNKIEYRCVCHCGMASNIHPNNTIKWWKLEHAQESGHKPVLIKLCTIPYIVEERE